MEDESEPQCRICLEETCEDGDEFLSPCLCKGSARYVHRSCLDEWRISGFDPKTLTHCGTCKACFRVQQPSNAFGAQLEVVIEVARYVGTRLLGFLLVIVVLGFIPRLWFGVSEEENKHPIWNHLKMGSVISLASYGGWAVLQAIWTVNIFGFHNWDFSGSKDSFDALIIILVVVGLAVLIWKLMEGVYDIVQTGGAVAASNIRVSNKQMRVRVVKRYPVLNYYDGAAAGNTEELTLRARRKLEEAKQEATENDTAEELMLRARHDLDEAKQEASRNDAAN
eukprot:TRINITY_DN15682_c0_g2_i3.p1 TRINITY_DN15682_c0_g2~~TRINITY_DN15682_c0_g2_i3.p1  ORF type:complete len:281 (-),score=40.53 TRINITY_DN15682_c0_g2_i3:1234-2076(-)